MDEALSKECCNFNYLRRYTATSREARGSDKMVAQGR
jgi:hypothetical protein